MNFKIVNKDISLSSVNDYPILEELVETLTGFIVRDEGLYLSVKNKGQIGIDAWNEVAGKFGYEDDYETLGRINDNLIQTFYEVTLRDNDEISWGSEVRIIGRSNGYWGFNNDSFSRVRPILTVKDSVANLIETYVLLKLEAVGLSFDSPIEDLISFFDDDPDLYGVYTLGMDGDCVVDFADNLDILFDTLMAEEEDLSVYFEVPAESEEVLTQFEDLIESESQSIEELTNGYDEVVESMLDTENDDDYLFESKKKFNESDEPNDRMLLAAINQVLEEDLNFLGKLEVISAQGPKGTMYHIDLNTDLELVGNATTTEWMLQFRKGMLGIDGLRYLQKEILRKLLPAMDKLTSICEHYK